MTRQYQRSRYLSLRGGGHRLTHKDVSHWGCGAKEDRISESFLKRFYHYLTGDERVGDLMRETVTADDHIAQARHLRHKLPSGVP